MGRKLDIETIDTRLNKKLLEMEKVNSIISQQVAYEAKLANEHLKLESLYSKVNGYTLRDSESTSILISKVETNSKVDAAVKSLLQERQMIVNFTEASRKVKTKMTRKQRRYIAARRKSASLSKYIERLSSQIESIKETKCLIEKKNKDGGNST